jgi:hypothetical protein
MSLLIKLLKKFPLPSKGRGNCFVREVVGDNK